MSPQTFTTVQSNSTLDMYPEEEPDKAYTADELLSDFRNMYTSKEIFWKEVASLSARTRPELINQVLSGWYSGQISPHDFVKIMTEVGYARDNITKIMQDFAPRMPVTESLTADAHAQYNLVERQVKAAKTKPVSPTMTPELAEPARPRTRAECIRVRYQQEERVVINSEGKRRRKKAI